MITQASPLEIVAMCGPPTQELHWRLPLLAGFREASASWTARVMVAAGFTVVVDCLLVYESARSDANQVLQAVTQLVAPAADGGTYGPGRSGRGCHGFLNSRSGR